MSPARTVTRTTSLLVGGAVVAALVGILHLVVIPDGFEGAPYVGVLFIVGGIAPLAAAAAMVLPALASVRRPAILLMALASVVMIVMGLVSRLTGLPGAEKEDWAVLIVASLVLELVFVLMTPALLRSGRSRR